MGHYRICRVTRNREQAGCFSPTLRSCVLLRVRQRRANEGESAAGRIDGLLTKAAIGRSVSSWAAVTILTVGAGESAAQTGVYLQMDMGAAMAPPLTVDGSDNDWSTKCDLIINPLGLETGSECDAAPTAYVMEQRVRWSGRRQCGGCARLRLGALSDSKGNTSGNTSTGSRPITLSQTWASSMT